MREFKFRAWEKDKKEMHYNPKIGHSMPTVNTFFQLDTAWYIPMQYTGCHDSEDKEIYEGDIITHINHGGRAEIAWQEADAKFDVYWDEEHEGLYADMYHSYWWKVIGNIYENPEMRILNA